jgi:L-iditol 2-dehydrogenase
VIVTSGSLQAISQAVESVERGGTILFFAPTTGNVEVRLPFNELFWRTEVTLISTYAGSPADYKEALGLIERKKMRVSDMITHRLPLVETGLGFKLVEEAKESIKVIVYPQR